jgi:hypothetical protein
VVVFLAMGWHTQVRYSALIPIPSLNKPYSAPKDIAALQQQISDLNERVRELIGENGELRYDAARILTDDQKQEWKAALDKRAKRRQERAEWRLGIGMNEYEDLRQDNVGLRERMDFLMRAYSSMDDAVNEVMNNEQKQTFKAVMAKKIIEIAE